MTGMTQPGGRRFTKLTFYLTVQLDTVELFFHAINVSNHRVLAIPNIILQSV